MPTKIFVGRLSEGTSSDEVRTLFRKFGAVTECDVLSGYGFVVSTYAVIFMTVYGNYCNFCILCYACVYAISS